MNWAKQHKLLATVVGTASALIALFAVFVFIPWILGDIKTYKIPSEGMKPTLELGDRVVARKADGKVGEIITFHPPVTAVELQDDPCAAPRPANQSCAVAAEEKANVSFVSRIVAGPGDRVAIRNGQVILNGRPQTGGSRCEEDLSSRAECELPKPITVPDDHFFIVSDNRGGALDSRSWGPLPKEWVTGHVVFRYAPLDRIGTL